MTANRKAIVRDLASTAHELESRVLEGIVRQGPEGIWMVGETPVAESLRELEGQEIVLIAA
jgi:hypothetical protein